MNPKLLLRSRLLATSLLVLSNQQLAMISGQEECFDDIQSIADAENSISDYSQLRTYTLCPRHIFEIGRLDNNYEVKGWNVDPPIPIRPNMHIKCGDTASRDNLCWIATGDLHLDASNVRGIQETSVENVLIEGLVFLDARKHSLWANKPGDITFRDCEWREHTKSVAPVMLDHFDSSSSAELGVTFENCLFTQNRFFGLGSNTALVYANGGQNRLTFRRTVFEQNDMVFNNTLADTNSFLIETLGPLTMDRTCFNDNVVGVSNVVVFGNTFSPSIVSMRNSTGKLCGFASVFQTLQQFERFVPLCVNALSPVCAAIDTMTPTMAPTTMPSMTPSHHPTGRLTSNPTVTPGNPTAAPIQKPTAAPLVTRAPITTPFVFPSDNDDLIDSGGGGRSFSLTVLGLTALVVLLGA